MDETQKLAMSNLCKEIKHNIETTNPQDKASIAKLEEIKNKSKVTFLLPLFLPSPPSRTTTSF